MPRRLIVVRHAQAQAHADTDHARELTAAGRNAAHDLGRWLHSEGIRPDYALVSSAARTRQTWDAIAGELDAGTPTEVSDSLYHAGPEEALEVIRWVPVEAGVVAVVGHNPTMGQLPHLLDDGSGDQGILAEVAQGYPTAAATLFEFAGDWSDLTWCGASLKQMYVGARD